MFEDYIVYFIYSINYILITAYLINQVLVEDNINYNVK